MSELKVIKIELNNHGKPIASIQGTTSYYGISPNDTFYPKSEVDKVIAEKDKEIADLIEKNKRLANKDIIMASETIKDLFKELRHHKHKRCLAMAKYCEAMRGHYLSYEEPKWFWYREWSKRWLELSEKFKEEK